MELSRPEAELSAGDWVFAVLSLLLTPLIPLLLGIYNLIRGRRRRAVLYFSVFGVGALGLAAVVLARA